MEISHDSQCGIYTVLLPWHQLFLDLYILYSFASVFHSNSVFAIEPTTPRLYSAVLYYAILEYVYTEFRIFFWRHMV